jgi:hypothetical protein
MTECIEGFPLDINREVVDTDSLFHAIDYRMKRCSPEIVWFNIPQGPHMFGIVCEYCNEGHCMALSIVDQNAPDTLFGYAPYLTSLKKAFKKYPHLKGRVRHLGTLEDQIITVQQGFSVRQQLKVRKHLSGPSRTRQEIVCSDWGLLVGYASTMDMYEIRAARLLRWLANAPIYFRARMYSMRGRSAPPEGTRRVTILAQQEGKYELDPDPDF